MIKRYTLLLIASALIGSLSAIAYPLGYPIKVILRGLTLSLCLTIGTIIVNYLNRDHLNNNAKPSLIRSAITGISMGLIAGLIMTLPGFEIKPMVYVSLDSDDKSIYYNGVGIVICALYGIAIHTAYALRWRFKNKLIASIVCIGIASVLTGLVRLILIDPPASFNNILNLWDIYTITQLLTTSFPFCLLWLMIHAACDPAWTFERWEETTRNDYLITISAVIYPLLIITFHYLIVKYDTFVPYTITIYILMLSGFLTLGTNAINRLTQKSLNKQIAPSWLIALLVGGGCALLFSSVILGINSSLPDKQIRYISSFYIDMKDATNFMAASFLFGLIVHTAYSLRWVIRSPFIHFFVMLIAGVICYFAIPALLVTDGRQIDTAGLFFAPISVMIWYGIHCAFDPAWSFDRWQKQQRGY